MITDSADDSLPVTNVTWLEANAFCRRLSLRPEEQAAGRWYRLPSEAEWEYACRSGNSEAYDWPRQRRPDDASGETAGIRPPLSLRPVGSYPANAFGLFDTRGNAWEWTADWFDRDYYHRSPVDDPRGPEHGFLKVVRGGDWRFIGEVCRIDYPMMPPWKANPFVGFRVVCEQRQLTGHRLSSRSSQHRDRTSGKKQRRREELGVAIVRNQMWDRLPACQAIPTTGPSGDRLEAYPTKNPQLDCLQCEGEAWDRIQKETENSEMKGGSSTTTVDEASNGGSGHPSAKRVVQNCHPFLIVWRCGSACRAREKKSRNREEFPKIRLKFRSPPFKRHFVTAVDKIGCLPAET